MIFSANRQLTLKKETIVGTLMALGQEFNFSFSNGYCLTIIFDNGDFSLKDKLKEKSDIGMLKIIYGKDIDGGNMCFITPEPEKSIVFHKNAIVLVVDIVLRTVSDDLIDKNGKSLGFKAIDFLGTPINSIFSPKLFINHNDIKENSIEWISPAEVAKVYPTKINGKACNLIFTGMVVRQDSCLENIDLGETHSIMRIEFEEKQDLSIIEDCWRAVCLFLSFCLGRKNVTNLYIFLWNDNRLIEKFNYTGLIDCYINNDKADDIKFTYPPLRQFQVNWLGDNIGELFKLINTNTTKPILSFLPNNNNDVELDYNKVRDLCTALEVEWEYWKEYLSNPNVTEIVKDLKAMVKERQKSNPTFLDNNTYNYILSSISYISLPAKKKILSIYMRYADIINEQCNDRMLCCRPVNISLEQTEKDINLIVDIRNSITHSVGCIDTRLPNLIYTRLKIAIYCSILERAGYTKPIIREIIGAYFSGFMQEVKQEETKDAD